MNNISHHIRVSWHTTLRLTAATEQQDQLDYPCLNLSVRWGQREDGKQYGNLLLAFGQ
jgi:hypothetical protein